MKLYQNVFDADDLWLVDPREQTKFIDCVEFVYAVKPGSTRKLLMRKDALKASSKPMKTLFDYAS
jgi:hypothetical protein